MELNKGAVNVLVLLEIIWRKFTRFFKVKKVENSILIIKADVLGDYIVFRNNLAYIRNSPTYKNYKITLLANNMLKDVATALDGKYVDEFIWFDYKKYNDVPYKRAFFKTLSQKQFREVVSYHYSRTMFTDFAVFAANAKKKIGMSNDFTWISPRVRMITDKFFTQLFYIPDEFKHEFEKNICLTNFITKQQISTSAELPVIVLANEQPVAIDNFDFNKPYIVISSGAGEPKRMLPYNKLLLLVHHLLNTGTTICFIGTRQDAEFVNTVAGHYPEHRGNIIDLTGKTTILQMLYVIKHAAQVFCNESGVYHIAVALKKQVTCFSGGGHFNRWAVYPTMKDITLVYNKMPCFNCDWHCIYKINPGESYPCIQSIQDEKIV